MSLENDLFGGKGIFSISGSNGITTLGQVVDIKYNTKAKSSPTLDGDPFTFFEQHKLSCRFVETGQDILDTLEEIVDSKNTYFILGSPSVIFKDSRFKPSIDRNWRRDGKFNSITLETATVTSADVSGSIRNLLGISGSVNTEGEFGLAEGLIRVGDTGSNIQQVITGSVSNLTSSEGFVQRINTTSSDHFYQFQREFPCKGNISLAFSFDVIAVNNAAAFHPFVGLFDVDENLIVSASDVVTLGTDQSTRVETRKYFRGVTEQVRYIRAGMRTSGSSLFPGMRVDLDNFMLEWGRASSFVPR